MKLPKQMLAINLYHGMLTVLINCKKTQKTQPRQLQHYHCQHKALKPVRSARMDPILNQQKKRKKKVNISYSSTLQQVAVKGPKKLIKDKIKASACP